MGGGDAGSISVRGESLPGNMTGYGPREGAPIRSMKEIFQEFAASIRPMERAGKLTAVLFQFPPWYECTLEHVRYIRCCRQAFPDISLAVEFRNRTWFEPRFRSGRFAFSKRKDGSHAICDEPQAGIGSVPIVPAVTHPRQALIRFHGCNRSGWNQNGRSNADWRSVRYAYRYTGAELMEWVKPRSKTEGTGGTGDLAV